MVDVHVRHEGDLDVTLTLTVGQNCSQSLEILSCCAMEVHVGGAFVDSSEDEGLMVEYFL